MKNAFLLPLLGIASLFSVQLLATVEQVSIEDFSQAALVMDMSISPNGESVSSQLISEPGLRRGFQSWLL